MGAPSARDPAPGQAVSIAQNGFLFGHSVSPLVGMSAAPGARAVKNCSHQDDQALRDQLAGIVDGKDGHHHEQKGKGQHAEKRAPDPAFTPAKDDPAKYGGGDG